MLSTRDFLFTLILTALFLLNSSDDVSCHCQKHNFCENSLPSCNDSKIIKDELPGYELALVHVIWRHGERAPNGTYPTSPNQEDKWYYGWEELTTRSLWEMYELGQILRRRYILERSLLSKRYSPKEIYVRSTDLNRALQSAQANMAGMYTSEVSGVDIPSKKNANFWPGRWIPVPIHAPATIFTDRILPFANVVNCPRRDQISAELWSTPKYLQMVNESRKFLDYVSKKAGVSTPYILPRLVSFYDAVWRERHSKMPQPSWLTDAVYERVRNLTLNAINPYYVVFAPWARSDARTDVLIRLIGGPILKDIINRIALKWECLSKNNSACESIVNDVQKIKDLKYYAHSNHGQAFTSIGYALGIVDEMLGNPLQEPPQGASLIFELWSPTKGGSVNNNNNQSLSDTQPLIRILIRESVYQGDYRSLTQFVPICNGAEFCPFSSLKQTVQKYLPGDIEKECIAL